MVTTKQCIKRINQLVLVSVEISVQFQKIPIADIENFAISAADILPIRYIGTSLTITYQRKESTMVALLTNHLLNYSN